MYGTAVERKMKIPSDNFLRTRGRAGLQSLWTSRAHCLGGWSVRCQKSLCCWMYLLQFTSSILYFTYYFAECTDLLSCRQKQRVSPKRLYASIRLYGLSRQIHIECQSKHNYIHVIYKVLVYVQTS